MTASQQRTATRANANTSPDAQHVQAPSVAASGDHLKPEVILGDTLPEMFWTGVSQRGAKVLLRQKKLGLWRAVTWSEAGVIVRDICGGLIELGLESGECVSILSNTVEEWLLTDFAVLSAGGVCSGIYPTDAPGQVKYMLEDSKSRYVFVEDEEQLDKVLQVRSDLLDLHKIFVFDMEGLLDLSDDQVMSFAALRELGAACRRRDSTASKRARWQQLTADDIAILVYTSGTTGKPKGAQISHRNALAVVKATNEVMPQYPSDDRMAFLPMCHIAERAGCYTSVAAGTTLNFVENFATVPENVREISPTVLGAVPRVWEKFYSAVSVKLTEATAFQRLAYRLALGTGEKVAAHRQQGTSPSVGSKLAFWLADWLVLGNVKRSIGLDRARILITGAAPISPNLVRWYLALGLHMIEGWGQTETSGLATITPLGEARPGTVGKPLNGVEMRVSAEGELLVRGDLVFRGYLNLPEKTAETIVDGWLHTGDVGTIDNDGYVRITDRIKDIIITAGGKNITPSEIENELKFSPFITDAVVIGDRRAYLTCLIMLDQENAERYAQERSIPFSSYASLCHAEAVNELIDGEIRRVNTRFANVEQIRKFRIIDKLLTAEDDELTPTMKLKRKVMHEKYETLVESMYE